MNCLFIRKSQKPMPLVATVYGANNLLKKENLTTFSPDWEFYPGN